MFLFVVDLLLTCLIFSLLLPVFCFSCALQWILGVFLKAAYICVIYLNKAIICKLQRIR